MPRAKPYRCHTCGTLYTGARCPKCYPPKKKRRSSGGRSRSHKARTTAAQVLARDRLPPAVNASAAASNVQRCPRCQSSYHGGRCDVCGYQPEEDANGNGC